MDLKASHTESLAIYKQILLTPNLIWFLLIHLEDPHMKEIIYYFLVLYLLTISVWGPTFARDTNSYPEESDGKGKGSPEKPY